MARTRVKICGLTRPEDVRAAVDAGADACGFIFAPSPRRVLVDEAARLAALVPPPVARVGVFVDASLEEICSAVEHCRLTSVQLSGSEPPESLEGIPVPVIKVLKVGMEFGWKMAEPYRGRATALLLDTYTPHKEGGTSQSFAWDSIGEPPGWAPIFVAGGLNPSNVGACIRVLRPFAVDVSSGVEAAPGIKDSDKILSFLDAVNAVHQEVRCR